MNDVKLTVPRWRLHLHAWSGRIGHLYRSMATTLSSPLPEQCCQTYDNYRICTIILTSVRCTISNEKKSHNVRKFQNFVTLQMMVVVGIGLLYTFMKSAHYRHSKCARAHLSPAKMSMWAPYGIYLGYMGVNWAWAQSGHFDGLNVGPSLDKTLGPN